MDKIKHPKRYKAYQDGYENGRIYQNNQFLIENDWLEKRYIEYVAENAELKKQLKSAKNSIVRIIFEDDKAINELSKIKEAYKNMYTINQINLTALLWFLAGVVLTSIVYFAINNTLV